MSAEQYAFGKICSWHGPVTFAKLLNRLDEDGAAQYVCPRCQRPLTVTTAEAFWSAAHGAEKAIPDYVGMLRWSESKCFPDFATMQDAYRQEMEGQ